MQLYIIQLFTHSFEYIYFLFIVLKAGKKINFKSYFRYENYEKDFPQTRRILYKLYFRICTQLRANIEMDYM